MTRANFFILGAPKCGTTSLSAWLSQHSGAFVSDPKEPRHFNTDWASPFRVADPKAYARLFADAGDRRARGEATTGYLVSDVAVPGILEYQPDARFVVCLRDPVELFFSLHGQRLKEGTETLMDPARAWEAQSERLQGRNVPRGVADPKSLHYDRFCRLGSQMSRLYEKVPRERVFVVLIEDLRDAPDATFRALCRFLDIEERSLPDYSVENAGRLPRLLWLQRAVRLAGLVKKRIGLPSMGIATRIRDANLSGARRSDDTALRARLTDHFAEEVTRLEQMIGRDLSHWRARSTGQEVLRTRAAENVKP
ncbi:sulfotransferase family protein [Roseovarius sp.]|uniref:sulfotransferase family protein n=1 Tax=Roseovarius sp. TaxID=1486281 RepID=UPI00356A7AB2